MTMSPRVRIALLTVAGLIFTVLALFGASRWMRSGEILGSLTVAGHEVELGSLTPIEAGEILAVIEQERSAEPLAVEIEGRSAAVVPDQLGFKLDVTEMIERAMARGREGGISDQFRWWLTHLLGTDELEMVASVDSEAVEAVLAVWDVDVVGEPPVPGGVVIEGTTPVPVYQETGLQIDRSTASDRLLAAAVAPQPPTVQLDTVIANSRVTRADVDAAVARAELWLSSPVELAAGDVTIEFSVIELANAFVSTVVEGRVELGFDPGIVGGFLETRRGTIEAPPANATFVINGYFVEVVPGRSGTLIDPEATAEALVAAASSVRRQGQLPFVEGAEPELTTADLEALNVRHLVSEFTTYHPCCQNRVTNIHLFADLVDGAIVLPGQTFRLNDHVGERTTERGFLEDGTIVRGELVPTVGGGVSQFATTFYNAVFWGGYEEIEHKPHSFFISRYPEGIEATISWQQPELAFRNDSASAILIKTAYTDTSITVRFYGSNDGRILVGDHASGSTNIRLIDEGGPNARRVSARTGGRFNPTEPVTEYRADPTLEVDEVNQLQSPSTGWTVTVTRVIDQGGTQTEQSWTVRYIARREILAVHPCKIPDATEPCPEPSTTTTLPPETTTTAPPDDA